MNDRAMPTSADPTRARSQGDRDLTRVLALLEGALLEGDHTGAITVAALRERGVKAPAQAVYTLQLAGYAIDRVSCTDPGGHKTLGYRLATVPEPDRPAALHEVGGDIAPDATDAGTVRRLRRPHRCQSSRDTAAPHLLTGGYDELGRNG